MTADVTVVVATYRRARLIPRLLHALEQQTVPLDEFQVILVDDASGEDTASVAAAVRDSGDLDVRLLRRQTNGGPAAARNDGWQAASTRWIAFTDDDCVPAPDWLENGLAALRAGARVVSGRTVPDPAQADQLGPFSRTIRAEDGQFVQTCNAFYCRDDLHRLRGFDRTMRTGEDTDLALRARAAGMPVHYEHGAVVHHDVRPSSVRATLRETTRWTDLPLVVRRHPAVRDTLLHRRIWWKPSHPPTALALAGVVTAAATRRTAPLVAAAPWLRYRLAVAPLTASRRGRVRTLAAAFAVDALEVAVMARGSWKHRTLLL